MTERLDALLDALLVALGSYLSRLHAAWGAPSPAVGAAADVGRLLAGIALPRTVHADERTAFATALDRGEPLLGLDPADELAVAAAWWSEADPQVAVALGCAHDDGTRRYASAALLRLVLAPFDLDPPPEHGSDAALVRGGLLAAGAGPDGPLRLTPTARRVLSGLPAAEEVDVDEPPARLAPVRGRLAELLAERRGPVVLRGTPGTGRHALAAGAARQAAYHPVRADLPAPEVRLLARLGDVLPVVPAARLEDLAWTPADGPLVAVGEPRDPAHGAYPVDLPAPGPTERRAHWATRLAAAGLDEDRLAARLAARFAFTEDDIDRALATARADAAWAGRDPDPDDVWRAARRQPEHTLSKVATLVTPAFTLDDLALAPDTRAQLDELVAHVTYADLVLDEWGFRRRLPRGQGVAALFAGASGTGKTMAAEAVADALGQDLYRIDLSAVVSKYIGETEKNLALAFDEAERAAAVLFFDECDALFGKRTEQHDAHDRWANLEVNYLLQRVETFTGLVVLATNKRAALDEAFLRRLRFSVRFEMPGAELRRALWLRSFPPDTPREELDWDALAAAELAGGNIQGSALAAAYLAAAEGGRVAPAHVERALRREFEKIGKSWTRVR